ncbi:Ig-like domain-containing protein [Paenibacillus sp. MMS20-IR301]|uniref:Ig-like domain-containing protein n=1 Tax=Paenibacillus sp. MMS20-IR301 TaxID=2895946 RepID=UPI0028ECBD71|nr:Ig-like domain-containing protein [Paenibacillus sp. MMS20-IR301]WNS41557.1 Ig-like domain-containing protein [Paenibacillus sp. MMS20-IR301]
MTTTSKKYNYLRRMANVWLAIILFIPSLMIGGTVSAASGWSIIDGSGPGGINVNSAMSAEKPAVAEWNGEIYAAWRERIQTTPAIYQIRVKKFNGSGWVSVDGNHPVTGLNADTTKDTESPALAVYNNALYLSWTEKKTSSIGQIRVKKYDGTSWTSAEGGSLTGLNVDASKNAYGNTMMVYKGELYVAWSEAAQIRVKKYNGTTWTSADGGGAAGLNISPASGAASPVMAVSGDELFVMWSEAISGSTYQLRVKKYDGATWTVADGEAGLNQSNSNHANNPSATVINDVLYVAWAEPTGGRYSTDDQVRVKKFEGGVWSSMDGGGQYGINVNGGARTFTVKLAALNDELYAVWSENSGEWASGVPVFKIRVKKYDGTAWVSAESGRIGLNVYNTQTATSPSVTAMNGALYAVWDESDRTTVKIRAARFTLPPAPSVNSVTVSPVTASIQQGGSRQLTAVVDAVGEAPSTVTWSSSDTSGKVAVSAAGQVTAAADATPGEYTITAASTHDNSKTGTAKITVTYKPAVTSVSVNPVTASLKQGESTQLTATVAAVGGASTAVTWSSSNAGKVAVSAAGKVTVAADAAPGVYTITAASAYDNSKSAAAVITVSYAPAINSVSVSPAAASLMQGESRQLTGTVEAVGGAATTLTWASSDTGNKVAVSSTGNVTVAPDAVPGDYTITAASAADTTKTGTSVITVTYAPAVYGVTVSPVSAGIMQGAGRQLQASVDVVGGAPTDVIWSSSDTSGKVTVSSTGDVTVAPDAVPGDYTITATSSADSGKAGTATVTVTYAPAIHGISVNPESASVKQGESRQLTATVDAVGGALTTVLWSSSDTSNKVSVDVTGKVSVASDAVPGDYTITVASTADPSRTATAAIKVTYAPAVLSITVSPVSASVMQGESRQLAATVVTVGGAAETVTWSSSDATNKVTVSATGYVTVAADAVPGDYTITAISTADSSKKGNATITVTAAPTYTIAPIKDRTLWSLQLGYGSGTQETITIPVQHTGTGDLADLSAALGGNDADAFVILTQPASGLGAGDETSFTLRAKDGLPAGTYTAEVTITAEHMLPVTFKVTQAVNLPDAPANPRNLTAEGGDREVTLNWETEPEVKQYRIYMATDADPDHRVEVAADASSPFTLPGLVNGTTYYFVVKAENPGGLSGASNLVSATPSTVPGAPADVTAAPGDGQAVVSFTAPADNGGSPVTGYEVTVLPGGKKVTGSASPVTITGLSNGTSYTFTVKAINGTGPSAESAESGAVVPAASTPPTTPATPVPSDTPATPSPTTGPATPAPTMALPTPAPTSAPVASGPPATPDPSGVDVLVNGKAENAGQAAVSRRDGQTALTIVIDQQKLNDRLKAEGQHAVVTIPINQTYDVFVGELTGAMIRLMEDYQAVLEFRTGQASYTVPAGLIHIGEIAAQVGATAALQDIKVQIEIAAPVSAELDIVERAAAGDGLTLVAQPLNFTVNAVYGDKISEIRNFDAYVERTIAIPDGVDPNKITTGVVVEPDGSVRHVPTKVRQNNGRYEAQINSLTNSTYAVVWHPLQFADVADHWGKDAVNDMGSRMVVEGIGGGNFNPNQAVTRAEFAAIVVRGLGLRVENRDTVFSDVQAENWFSGAVHTAHAYGLIDGFKDGTFRPDDRITREQAMVIVARAMTITGLKGSLEAELSEAALQKFDDGTLVSSWARSGVTDSVWSGLVQGRSQSLLVPGGQITRAEAAAIMQRLLQKSDLI